MKCLYCDTQVHTQDMIQHMNKHPEECNTLDKLTRLIDYIIEFQLSNSSTTQNTFDFIRHYYWLNKIHNRIAIKAYNQGLKAKEEKKEEK